MRLLLMSTSTVAVFWAPYKLRNLSYVSKFHLQVL